jgi:peptidyl-prolyl cis-trans isomerase D
MAKNPRQKQSAPTKKHLARLERERQQIRYITIASILVLLLVIGSIGYGILDQNVLKGLRPVVVVNGEKISANEFRAETKYYRSSLINEANRMIQLAQLFGNSPSFSITDQLSAIGNEMDPFQAGSTTLNQMTDNLLIRQEAKKRGVTVTQQEIDERLEAEMRYFPNGTPTPTPTMETIPTSTLSPLQLTMMPRTATPTPILTGTITSTAEITATLTPLAEITPEATEVLTPTATATPQPTPTTYTSEAYQEVKATTFATYQDDYGVSEETIRHVIETNLLREKMIELIAGDTPCTQEQVWAEHILVDTEELARDIYQRLKDGENWDLMAATYSTDTSNKNDGGDLGWFARGQMVTEFEDVAFSLPVGEISEPVQTQFGWHIIRVLGHEDRSVSAATCDQLKADAFQKWLDQVRAESKIETSDFWREVVPLQPTLPPEIEQIIQQSITPTPQGFPESP